MTKDKEKKDIDQYLEEMMGTFTDEEKKEAVKAALKNLGIEVPEKAQNPKISQAQKILNNLESSKT